MAVQIIPYPANSLPAADAVMSQSTGNQPAGYAASPFLTANSEVMVAAVIFLFVVLVFVFFLYLYAKHYWVSERRRADLIFAASGLSLGPMTPIPRRGLGASVLEELPVTIFRSADFEEEGGLECSVCLSEVSEGEEVRMLPKCSHGFHLHCIDMWFHSHSTCPLCRTPVVAVASSDDDGVVVGIPAPAPEVAAVVRESAFTTATSVASETSSSSKPDGMLVIEIPSRAMMEGFRSPASTSSKGDQEIMKTPTSARRRSLMRMLSRGKRAMESSGSSPTTRGVSDQVVRGGAGENNQYRIGLPPKTPKIL